ncbi:MAG TPA: cupin domain-containing protein [Angustibacter sp.]|nr:cupin domain-containing protein [Angustibacter sp.]
MTQLTTRPVVAPGDADVVNHLDMLCRVALSGADTGGAFSLVEERAARGACTPRHLHTREAETFIVLDGALEGWCEGAATVVEAGSMIHLPAGLEHAFRIASSSAHFYTLITPSGFESFFAATGRPAGVAFDGELPVPGPVPPEAATLLQQVLDPLGVSITGPPPFGG